MLEVRGEGYGGRNKERDGRCPGDCSTNPCYHATPYFKGISVSHLLTQLFHFLKNVILNQLPNGREDVHCIISYNMGGGHCKASGFPDTAFG